jgi:hypothetical protein
VEFQLARWSSRRQPGFTGRPDFQRRLRELASASFAARSWCIPDC